jgi:uncharacterized protein
MPNPVAFFEIRGRDPLRLHAFYREVFGWEIAALPNGYGLAETESHTHDEATGRTTYTGADSFINEGVVLEERDGEPVWRYRAEAIQRSFQRGIGGGIGPGEPGVTISVRVPNLEATLASVEAAGGRIVRGAREVAPGVVTAEFEDPEGNLIMLVRE